MRYEDMEYENYGNVLGYIISDSGALTRTEIARKLGLSKATVTQVINRFIAYGLVHEGEKITKAGKGRPGNLLYMDRNMWFVLAASLSENTWQFAIADLTGSIVSTYELPVSPMVPEVFMSRLIEGLKHMIGLCPGKLLPGVGIGVPGVVDQEKGDIVFAYDYGWNSRVNISGRIRQELHMESFVRNRNHLAGIAEYKYANPEKEQSMIYIGIGSGIRAAIFSAGHIIRGADGRAGRISHIQIDPDGKLCSCGKRGCLFTIANEHALLEDVSHLIASTDIPSVLREHAEGVQIREVMALAEEGDELALEAVHHVASAMTKAIRILSVVLNPRKIVLGGSVGDSEALVRFITQELRESAGLQDIYPEVCRCSIKPYGSVLGAVSLVIDNSFSLVYDDFISFVKQQPSSLR